MQLPDREPESNGKILSHDAGIGEASNAMVKERARELAKIAGLDPETSTENFMIQAREELRGDPDADAATDDEGEIAQLSAYDDVPGESGTAVAPSTQAAASSDEQTIGESLYSEGIAEADHDRMVSSRTEEDRDARAEEK